MKKCSQMQHQGPRRTSDLKAQLRTSQEQCSPTHGTCQAEYYDFEVTITSADAAMTVAAGRFKAGMYGRISLRT